MHTLHHIPEHSSPPCVATIGFFDGVHRGHRFLIEQVKEVAVARSLPSALITFPVHPRKVVHPAFHPRLLTTQTEKITRLAETGVDHCFLLDFTPELSQLSAEIFMTQILREKYNVQALLIGYDHRFGHNRTEGFEHYREYGRAIGMEVLRATLYKEENGAINSSAIRTLLLQGEIEAANRYLGYPYFLNGTVVSGYKLGRTMGFPTANIEVDDPDKLIPLDGVYAVYVSIGGLSYKGMLNIGHRPTIANGNRSIEVNILHFSGDIYRQPIRISLMHYLRPEIKFDSVADLMLQLERDRERVAQLLRSKN